jgi:predicted RNase H-like HicB family nuclease
VPTTPKTSSRKAAGGRLQGVVYERDGRLWTASLPAFPGAYSQGRTEQSAYRNLLLAIRDILDAYLRQARKSARGRLRAD